MNTLDTILTLAAMIAVPFSSMAQFHTITKDCPIVGHNLVKTDKVIEKEIITNIKPLQECKSDSNQINDNNSVFRNSGTVSKSRTDSGHNRNLPELTIPNLVEEIRRNGIKFPKIVLAQAILETGWFKSSVCRNKHNLFGLTNPRTGEYYEFSHWTESVRAYYTKVQYRYKGGNYLLWLKNIGYAEDPGYIRAVIRVLRQI